MLSPVDLLIIRESAFLDKNNGTALPFLSTLEFFIAKRAGHAE